MGDEGKGRVVHEILDNEKRLHGRPASGVMKVNGGANAGHTAAGLKLNLLPSGVGDPDVETLLIGSGVVADPRKFLWEAKPLESRGIRVFERLLIDQKCQVSDLSHRLLDLAWESYRVKELKMENRGSTGRGISPAYGDETSQWQIFYQSFLGDRDSFVKLVEQRLHRALDIIKWVCKVSKQDWYDFFDTLTKAETQANHASINEGVFNADEFEFNKFIGKSPFELNTRELIEVYWHAGEKLSSCIADGRDFLLGSAEKNGLVVAEFGQAFWLDKRHGFTPNVTASHTTPAEFFNSGGIPLQKITQIGCCKAYDTKVGTHHFLTRINQTDPWGTKLAKLEFGTSTGRQRMVGWFDAVEKGNCLRYGGFDQLVINKLDALTLDPSVPGHLKICTGYKTPEDKIIKYVPRDENLRKDLRPVYMELPGWKENIALCSSFEQLPLECREYVAHMVASIIDVAYPHGHSQKRLPEVRFLGIGPDPGQIISDVPSTALLLEGVSDRKLSPVS